MRPQKGQRCIRPLHEPNIAALSHLILPSNLGIPSPCIASLYLVTLFTSLAIPIHLPFLRLHPLNNPLRILNLRILTLPKSLLLPYLLSPPSHTLFNPTPSSSSSLNPS